MRGRDQQRRGGGGGGGGEGGGRSEAGGVERYLHKASGVTESQTMGNTEYIFLLEMKQG